MEKKYNVMVRVHNCATNQTEWKAVRPTHGTPYVWSKDQAEKYIETHSFCREVGNFKLQAL